MTWVSLPYPPTANNLFRNVPKRGRVKTAKYIAWLETATQLASMARKQAAVEGPYTLRIQAGKPDRRRRDVDNLIKPTSDALVNGGLVEADHLCQFVSAEWIPGITGLRVLVLPTQERV